MRRDRLDFDRLLELRRQYPMRGPRDGRAGLTPEGQVAPAERYRVEAVVYDADAAMRLGPNDHARWRAQMGLPERPETVPVVRRWSDECPARGTGLTHMRLSSDPPGRCAHCGADGLA